MPKRVLKGTVISSKSNKTIVVNVERRVRHPLYKKTITLSDKFHAHDENNNYKDGDKVSIIECKPISKKKSWVVIKETEN
ncbi:MAG: 30S ribosomal protein S17 [Pelagibacterales bacterium]|nr:30S ribosomal protein S17 [Pelagibacterales bacterium]|tara:strand:- start:3215 stop:3454 length:240 start_codon:yes stop_codon:yes gene_type:complete